MHIKYTLTEEDLKEYYHETLRSDESVRKFRIGMSIFGPLGILLFLTIGHPRKEIMITGIIVAVIWFLLANTVFFNMYLNNVTKQYLKKTTGNLKPLELSFDEKGLIVNKKRQNIKDYAVFPRFMVLLLEANMNVILPARVFDECSVSPEEFIAKVEQHCSLYQGRK